MTRRALITGVAGQDGTYVRHAQDHRWRRPHQAGLASELRLGNLDAKRDWGFAGDYVEAMWSMLQQDSPDDYVIAAGEVHTVRDFCAAAFSRLDLDYEEYVVVDPEFFRPVDVKVLFGDPIKARTRLGWTPKVTFPQLVALMADADLDRYERGA